MQHWGKPGASSALVMLLHAPAAIPLLTRALTWSSLHCKDFVAHAGVEDLQTLCTTMPVRCTSYLQYLAPLYAIFRKRWELPAFMDTEPACDLQVMATTGGVSARLAPPSLPLTCPSTTVRRSRHSALQRSCRSLFLELQLLHSAQHLQALLTPPC